MHFGPCLLRCAKSEGTRQKRVCANKIKIKEHILDCQQWLLNHRPLPALLHYMTISLLIATLIKWQRITWIKSTPAVIHQARSACIHSYSLSLSLPLLLSFSLALLPCVFSMFKYPLVWRVKTCSFTTVNELCRNQFTFTICLAQLMKTSYKSFFWQYFGYVTRCTV